MKTNEEKTLVHKSSPPRILITSGRIWSALAAARAFGKLGYLVDIVDNNPRAVSRYSKYCHRYYRAPNLTESPDSFARFVVNLVRQNPYDFVVPLFEEVFALSKYKRELSEYSRILINDFDVYMSLHNKGRLNDLCVANEIRTPRTIRLDTNEAIYTALNQNHEYPVFLKSPVSCAAAGVTKISNAEELKASLEKVRGEYYSDKFLAPILQQGIQGYQIATQAVYRDGELLAIHMYKNIAEFPPGSGTGVVRESVSHMGIKATMRKLGKTLNYNGLLGVDFLIDPESKKAYLIDANPRLPLGFQNSEVSGAKLMEAYINGIRGRIFYNQGYREGIKTRSLVPHLYWLFASIFKLGVSPVSALRTYWKDRHNSHAEIMDFGDFMPGLMLPWIFFRVQFQKGTTIMDKFLSGAVFTDETFVKI